jgi:hypothetical protein
VRQVEAQIRAAQRLSESHRDKLKHEQQGLHALSEALELLRSSNSQGKQELAQLHLDDQQARCAHTALFTTAIQDA